MLRTARHAARAVLCAAALAGSAVALPAPAHAAPAPACPGADVVPTAASLPAARTATLCLVNRERAKRGARRLRTSAALRASAQAYAADMDQRDFFAHVSPGGAGLLERVRRDGRYLRGVRRFRVGENLAWGSGERATPRETVKAWMASPGHRANLLDRRFRETGIGIALGAPVAGAAAVPAATYAHHFGRRG